jgi:succinoglycan biosynthesis protein ExoA
VRLRKWIADKHVDSQPALLNHDGGSLGLEGDADDSLPFVSVIMPVRNERHFIEASLGAVLRQDYPSERTEVIVADGMSTDGTREVIKAHQIGCPNLHMIDNPGQIVPTGLNAALEQARGSVIVRVDGHCEIASDHLSRSVEHLSSNRADMVGGTLETIGDTLIARLIAMAMSSRFGVGNSAFRTALNKTIMVDTVAFPAYTRAILDRGGLFDEELVRNQDDEYSYRLRELGARILLAADIRAKYYCHASLSSLWRQYFQYGYWKVRVMQKRTGQMRLRQFAPPAFVAALTVSLLRAPFSNMGAWVLAMIGGSYLSAAIVATALSSRSWKGRRKGILVLLPVCFAILHLAYGSGFLVGLVRFCNRWKSNGAAHTVRRFG